MAITSWKNGVCKRIADVLGIKHCRNLTIKMKSNNLVIVEAEFFLDIDGVEQLEPIFKEYKLVEK